MSARAMQRANQRRSAKLRKRLAKKGAIGAGAALGATVILAPAAEGAVFTVTNLDDAGPGSLRQAAADADAATGGDTITFANGLNGTITLTTGQIGLSSNDEALQVRGPGPDVITVSGNNNDRIFYSHMDSNFPVVISGLTLTQGNSSSAGGALYLAHGNFELQNMRITNSYSGADGGGMSLYQAHLEMRDTTISGNAAGDAGGAAYMEDDADYGGIEIIDSTITGNSSIDGGGGGIYFYRIYTGIDIQGSTFTNNFAGDVDTPDDGDGGAIYLYQLYDETHFRIEDSVISGNRATGDGGGVYLYQLYSDTVIEDTTIADNTAGDDGGGVYLYHLYDDANFVLRDSTVEGNRAEDGGGLFLYYLEGPARVVRSTISGNEATDEGGGIYLYDVAPSSDGDLTIRDTTIADNTASNTTPDPAQEALDLAVEAADPAGQVGAGGGIFLYDEEGATVFNSIIADNTGGDVSRDDPINPNSVLQADFSLIENPSEPGLVVPITPGSNIIGTDPQLGALADNGGPTRTQAPGPDSPVIDQGSTTFAVDQRGEVRPFDQADVAEPALAGADASDMGAVELSALPTGSCKGERATVALAPGSEITKGTAGRDVFVGNNQANTFKGLGGNDLICARGGDDDIFGGKGKDSVFAGGGADNVNGNEGNDTVRGEGGNDRLNGNKGNDKVIGGGGQDRLSGGLGNDSMFGNDGRDRLAGEAGNDLLNGGAANDILIGAKGDDRLKGGPGNDRLFGGKGTDVLNGGPGRDQEIPG